MLLLISRLHAVVCVVERYSMTQHNLFLLARLGALLSRPHLGRAVVVSAFDIGTAFG